MPCYRNADHKNVHVFEELSDLCQCQAATTIDPWEMPPGKAVPLGYIPSKLDMFTLAAFPVVAEFHKSVGDDFILEKIAEHTVAFAKATIAELEKETSK